MRRLFYHLIIWSLTERRTCFDCDGTGEVFADISYHTGVNYTKRREACSSCVGLGWSLWRPTWKWGKVT